MTPRCAAASLALTFGVVAPSRTAAQGAACLPYGPAQVELQGVLRREARPRAPGADSSATPSPSGRYLFLHATPSIALCADSLRVARDSVGVVQLRVLPELHAELLVGQRVHVIGFLEEMSSGDDLTPVVLWVRLISPTILPPRQS